MNQQTAGPTTLGCGAQAHRRTFEIRRGCTPAPLAAEPGAAGPWQGPGARAAWQCPPSPPPCLRPGLAGQHAALPALQDEPVTDHAGQEPQASRDRSHALCQLRSAHLCTGSAAQRTAPGPPGPSRAPGWALWQPRAAAAPAARLHADMRLVLSRVGVGAYCPDLQVRAALAEDAADNARRYGSWRLASCSRQAPQGTQVSSVSWVQLRLTSTLLCQGPLHGSIL